MTFGQSLLTGIITMVILIAVCIWFNKMGWFQGLDKEGNDVLGIFLLIIISSTVIFMLTNISLILWILGTLAVLGVIVTLSFSGIIGINRYSWYSWRMNQETRRVRRGRSDEQLSDYDRELIDKIQNHYRAKIDKLYS